MNTNPPNWSLPTRVLFRFAFVYLLLYILPFPLTLFGNIDEQTGRAWNPLVFWVARHVFHTELTFLPNGSGDTTWNYVQVVCITAIALLVTIVWSILDRLRRDYRRLNDFFRMYVRLFLGVILIDYGVVKVIQSQFPPPSLTRMVQPLGTFSPMGLLWTFMGTSRGYNLFTGVGELLPAALLMARRTATLGALIAFGVLSHVVVLNMCYDVPVKLFSMQLVLMAVFLLLADLPRLANVLLLNRPAEPADLRPLWRRPWLHWSSIVLRTALVITAAAISATHARAYAQEYASFYAAGEWSGVWNVEKLILDGNDRSPIATDDSCWRRVIIDGNQAFTIQTMDDAIARYEMQINRQAHTLMLTSRSGSKYELKFVEDTDTITLDGTVDGESVKVKIRRRPAPQFLLKTRGFHWINEVPLNR